MFPLKAFYWGQKGARDNFALQLRNVVDAGYRALGETPVLIGECGVPMDMKYVLSLASRTFRSSRPASQQGRCFRHGRLYLAGAHDGRHDHRARALPRRLHVRFLLPRFAFI